MCDYSLEHYSTVDAQQGESYTLHMLGSGSLGFVKGASVVCIKEGSLLRLEGLHSSIALHCGVGSTEEVIFSKLPRLHGHRDGITFKNGRQLLLQSIYPGCRITVLMPPASTKEDRDLVTPEPAPVRSPSRSRPPIGFLERMFSI
jgi:hypothetical protein